MIHTLCGQINLMCFFGRFKRPKICRFILDTDVRLPIVSVLRNAKQTRRRTFLRGASVLRVYFRSSRSKVCNPIVIPHIVYVVDKFWWLLPVVVHPCQAMRSITSAKSKYAQVPAMVFAARIISQMHSLGNFFTPVKNTRCGVIIKHISNVFGRYFHGADLSTYAQHRGSIA